MSGNNAIEISDLSFSYRDVPVLEKIDLVVPRGDFLGIVGPNGSGKTTLLRLILGLLTPDTGTIRIFDHEPHFGCRHIGYVPQHVVIDSSFPVSVADVVLMGRLPSSPLFVRYSREDREKADEALRQVGIADLRHRQIGTLSGGQLQRMLIARALVSEPEMLLLDEPTANIDTGASGDVYDLLHKINEEATIVLVTHDLGFVSTHVSRVACLNRRLVFHPTRELTGEILQSFFEAPLRLVEHHRIDDGEETDG